VSPTKVSCLVSIDIFLSPVHLVAGRAVKSFLFALVLRNQYTEKKHPQ
jgi:hypothetical protein